jgi:hypothetical protein
VRTVWNIFGAVLVAIGAVWSGQGAGYITGSFMTDDRKWLLIGVAVACCGAALLVRANTRKGNP